jgi:hypothetical protein
MPGARVPGTKRTGVPAPKGSAAAPPSGAQPGPRRPPSPQAAFAQLDANGDGKIEKTEIPQHMQPFFSKLDKNSDGAVTRDEFAAFAKMIRQRHAHPGPPGGPRP